MKQISIPIFIATHGDLASALYNTVESIAGKQNGMYHFSLLPGDDVEAFKQQLDAKVRAGGACLILVDMPGGTPWNVALVVAAQYPDVRVVGGVNLPMLLEVALSSQRGNVEQLAHQAVEAGSLAVRLGNVAYTNQA